MAKWFKFEEKKPDHGKHILIWVNYLAEGEAARPAIWNAATKECSWLFTYEPVDFYPSGEELWQYAPKGPKEE